MDRSKTITPWLAMKQRWEPAPALDALLTNADPWCSLAGRSASGKVQALGGATGRFAWFHIAHSMADPAHGHPDEL
ncbi:MAG: hypothetical protein JNN07_16955 [Verrucomicrobiales bacterium]|nr:hypothetical protein [Verrucomicrobiales bacterium]